MQVNPSFIVDKHPGDLEGQIREAAEYGFELQSRTDTTATMIKRKRFSFIFALLWTLAFGIGLLLYVFWYLSRKNQMIYLAMPAVSNKAMEGIHCMTKTNV